MASGLQLEVKGVAANHKQLYRIPPVILKATA